MKRIFTPTKKKSILIVDNDRLGVHIYREKFEANGVRVLVARDAATVRQTVQIDDVDLVILDLCLPGINAVELIKNVRSDSGTQSLPVIALANPYLTSLTRAVLEAGATKSVAKVDRTPEQIVELARELGVSGTSRLASDEVG